MANYKTVDGLQKEYQKELALVRKEGDPNGRKEHALANEYQKRIFAAECRKERGVTCDECKCGRE